MKADAHIFDLRGVKQTDQGKTVNGAHSVVGENQVNQSRCRNLSGADCGLIKSMRCAPHSVSRSFSCG